MTLNPRRSFFDRLFGPGTAEAWHQRAAWESQKVAWKAQREAQKIAWKTERDARREAWKSAHRWRYRGPFAELWGLMWAIFWVGFALLLIISPEFRSRVFHFFVTLPQLIVHVLYSIAGRSEI